MVELTHRSRYVGLHTDADGTYPLRNRDAIIGILTNRAYIGWYVYNNVIVSRKAHDPLVSMEDFMYAWERLSKVSLDGTEEQETVARERRYGGKNALLDGILRSGKLPVYVVEGRYVSWRDNRGFGSYDMAVSVKTVDDAFSKALVAALVALEHAHRQGLQDDLYERVEALKQEQERQAVPWLLAMGRNAESFSGGEGGWACPFFLFSVRIVECRAAGEGGQNPTGAMEVA